MASQLKARSVVSREKSTNRDVSRPDARRCKRLMLTKLKTFVPLFRMFLADLMELRHKRYFENPQEKAKRKVKEARMRKKFERMQRRRTRMQETA